MDKQKLIEHARKTLASMELNGNEQDAELCRIALASLEAEPWGYTSGIRHPELDGAVVRDKQGVNQFPVYLAPPAPVVKLPSETVIHSEMDFIRKEKAKSRNETIAEVLRLNSSDTDSIDTTPQQYQSLSR